MGPDEIFGLSSGRRLLASNSHTENWNKEDKNRQYEAIYLAHFGHFLLKEQTNLGTGPIVLKTFLERIKTA